MSALQVYLEACRQHNVKKPSSGLCSQLKDVGIEELETVTLDGLYVGNRGLMALLDVISQSPKFRAVDFSGQQLFNADLSEGSVKGNTLIDHLLEVSRQHPSISSIDLGGNPISNFVARKLLTLATENSKIEYIGLADTRTDADVVALVDKQTSVNAEGETTDGNFGGFGAGLLQTDHAISGGGGVVRRKTVMTQSYDPEEAKRFVAPKYSKSPNEATVLTDLLKSSLLFSYLDSQNIQVCVAAMQKKTFKRGDTPLRAGDEGNTLYVIGKGACDIIRDGKKVAEKVAGSAFGELELMYDTPCVATVSVVTDELTCWALDRETYKSLVVGASIRKRAQYETLISTVPFLQELSPYEKSQLADALSSDEWEAGANIIEYGEEGQWMFLMVRGTVEVIGRDEHGKPFKVCEMGAGENFGELEFLENHSCVADVRAVSAVTTAKINRKHFEMCLGPVIHILKRNAAAPKYQYYQGILNAREKAQ